MASPTQWTWVWVNSGSWWWTGRAGVLQSMGLQRQLWTMFRHSWETELTNSGFHKVLLSMWRMNEQGCRHSQSESWCPGGLCTCKPYSLTNALLCMGHTEALTPPTHLPYRSVCSAPANPVTVPNSTSVLFNFSPLIPSFPSSHSTDDLTSYWTKKIEVNRNHFSALLSSNLSPDPMPSSLLILTLPISLASSRTWIVPSFFCNIGFSLPVGSFTSASCRSPHAGMSPVGGLPTRRWGRWGGEGEREEKGGEKNKENFPLLYVPLYTFLHFYLLL